MAPAGRRRHAARPESGISNEGERAAGYLAGTAGTISWVPLARCGALCTMV